MAYNIQQIAYLYINLEILWVYVFGSNNINIVIYFDPKL